ncbi:MAG: hypothetical protein JW806_09700 [Sedimentisphaerales bacterium]|nr:hypothetical protein [Sedimentisphaerales bacterium]
MINGETERRRHKRLDARIGVVCKKIDSLHSQSFIGKTINICPDGLLVQSSQDITADLEELFTIELEIPDIDSTDQLNGRVSAYARVIRIFDPGEHSGPKQIAFQFCTRPQFDI